MDLVDDLMEYGYITGQAYLGVTINTQDLDAATAAAYGLPLGARVQSVTEGSCADKAGLQAGDIITALGDEEVSGYSDLLYALRNFGAGDTTTVSVFRSGQELTLNITFDEKTADTPTGPVQETQPEESTQPEENSGEMPDSGSYEDWYNYFFPSLETETTKRVTTQPQGGLFIDRMSILFLLSFFFFSFHLRSGVPIYRTARSRCRPCAAAPSFREWKRCNGGLGPMDLPPACRFLDVDIVGKKLLQYGYP